MKAWLRPWTSLRERMTSADVAAALRAGPFREPAHAWLQEVRNGTGYSRRARYADALAISLYPSRGRYVWYTQLRRLSVKLDEANVTDEGRWVVVPPWFHGRLQLDSRFVKVNESGTAEGLRNGIIGRAAGFDIYKSNQTPDPTSGTYAIIAGHPVATTFAQQITKMEKVRSERTFGDKVRALSVFGYEVIVPKALGVLYARKG